MSRYRSTATVVVATVLFILELGLVAVQASRGDWIWAFVDAVLVSFWAYILGDELNKPRRQK